MTPDFAQLLRGNGYRATTGRVAILRRLWLARHPLTVDEIGRHLDLDVATVYRALHGLLQKGLVVGHIGAAGIEGDLRGDIRAARFSYPKADHHHHLSCVDCGFIRMCAIC